MQQILLIAIGGATGALLRFWMSSGIHLLMGRGFPYGTLGVNIIGSFCMGLLYVYLFERLALNDHWRSLLTIGLLGAFTTFSTFSVETLNLVEAGQTGKAAMNVALSVFLCIGACWLGLQVARQL